MSVLSSRLKERRKKMNMSQEDLAEAINTTQGQVSRYEKGDNDPTGDVLVILARTLQTSTDWLLGLTDDPNPTIHTDDLSNSEKAIIAALRRGEPYEAIRAIVGGDKEARSGA